MFTSLISESNTSRENSISHLVDYFMSDPAERRDYTPPLILASLLTWSVTKRPWTSTIPEMLQPLHSSGGSYVHSSIHSILEKNQGSFTCVNGMPEPGNEKTATPSGMDVGGFQGWRTCCRCVLFKEAGGDNSTRGCPLSVPGAWRVREAGMPGAPAESRRRQRTDWPSWAGRVSQTTYKNTLRPECVSESLRDSSELKSFSKCPSG